MAEGTFERVRAIIVEQLGVDPMHASDVFLGLRDEVLATLLDQVGNHGIGQARCGDCLRRQGA